MENSHEFHVIQFLCFSCHSWPMRAALPLPHHFLTFFATNDDIVSDNLLLNFASVVQSPEAHCFTTNGLQIIENAQAETCFLLTTMLIPAAVSGHTTRLFQAIDTLRCVGGKVDWAIHWCNMTSHTFSECLIVFATVERISSGRSCPDGLPLHPRLLTKSSSVGHPHCCHIPMKT
jgi:hypothetical protein